MSAPNCRTNMLATVGTCACATWLRPACIARICCSCPSRRRRPSEWPPLCEPAGCSVTQAVNSCLCRMDRSGFPCWRAPRGGPPPGGAWGLQRYASREFLSLSYGQKRLALLARALVQDPDWLLLDEFYNGLDGHYRARIVAVLAGAVRRGQSWVATAHRAADVPRGTHCMLELEDGYVRAAGRMRASDLKRLKARAGERPRSVKRAWKAAGAASAPGLIRLSQVDLYVDYKMVLRDLDWQLRKGEHWAVFGANGSGKTSFLKLLYGDLSPALGGYIERTGFPKGTPITDWKRHVGYVSPELQSDYAVNISVTDLVASGRYASIGLVDEPTAGDIRAARYWLRFFGLLSVAARRPRELSYGQLRRALIARAMAADARILLLDEPLTGLDPGQRAIMKRLLEHVMNRLTVIIAVHHPEDLPRGMTHGLRLHNRRAYPVDSYSATGACAKTPVNPAKSTGPPQERGWQQ